MSKDIHLNLSSFQPKIKKGYKFAAEHATFGAILIVLLIYVFMVYRISSLTSAEPKPEDETAALAQTRIPKVDKEAVAKIQALEASNAEIQSLFNSARNNPFLE